MDNKIFTRNLPIYTYLDKIEDTQEAQQLFLAECKIRKKIIHFENGTVGLGISKLVNNLKKRFSNEYNFIEMIENRYKEFISLDDGAYVFVNKLSNEDSYFIKLLSSFANEEERQTPRSISQATSFQFVSNEPVEDIIDDFFYYDIEVYLLDIVEDEEKEKIKNILKIMQCNSINGSIEDFINHLKVQKLYTEKVKNLINTKKEDYIKYRLIHTTKYKKYNEAPYIQIDLTLSDKELKKQIIKMKYLYKKNVSSFKLLNKKKPRAITKAIEYSNMLYTYDCRKLKYRVSVIQNNILRYCENINNDFDLSETKYKEYLTTAKQYIDE